MDVRVTPINLLLTIRHKSYTGKLNCVFLHVEHRMYRKTGIENWSQFSNGTVNFGADRSNQEKVSTPRSGLAFSNPFLLDRTDLFSFRPKFPDVLVEGFLLNGWSPRLLDQVYIFIIHACKEL